MTEDRYEERALHQHIRNRTVRLLDLTDKTCGGSAVTVKIEKRFFLATAAHVIPSGHEIQVLIGESNDENVGRFAARHLDEEDDVGLLEIEETVATTIPREFTEYAQLAARLDQRSAWSATLIGYPGQLVETQSAREGKICRRTNTFRTLALASRIIPNTKWPNSGGFQRRSPRADCDLFVEFDPSTHVLEQNLREMDQDELPTDIHDVCLAGMSGSGIWLEHYSDSTIWRPDPILVGILTGVKRKERWARGTLISQWVRLVARHYPEFRSVEQQLDPQT